MVNKKISDLPAAAAAAGANQFEINEAGTSKRVTNTQVATFMQTAFGLLTINGGTLTVVADGTLSIGVGNAFIQANGDATFGQGAFSFGGDGSAVLGAGSLSPAGALDMPQYKCNALTGVTGDFSILDGGVPKTFHFEGGILTSVT